MDEDLELLQDFRTESLEHMGEIEPLFLEIEDLEGDEQNEGTRLGIRLLAGGGPIVFLLLAAAFARNYPLDRARHREIVAALEARRTAAG